MRGSAAPPEGRASSAAAALALAAAAAAAGDDLELFDVLGVGEAAIDDRGHAIRTAFGYCLCVKCGGFSRDEQGRCKLLGAQCTGRFGSRDATGRLEDVGRARLRRITRILEGRHPAEAGRKL